MKTWKSVILLVALLTLLTSGIANAQVTYPEPALSSYSVVNLDTNPQTIQVTYYNANGDMVKQDSFPNVAPNGGTKTVQQATEASLPSGELSAVLGSGGSLAAIVNQQLGQVGNQTSIPPFSSYTAASGGATSVTIPTIMYNWFGYYTDVYIQNVSGNSAANITVTYNPTSIGACVTGASGQTDQPATAGTPLKKFASRKVSQVSKAGLGAPAAGGGCAVYNGRYLGSATITSDQAIAVVVNQNVQNKLFTYNGFVTPNKTLVVPAYMRNWYGYYASLTLANPGGTNALVDLTYVPGTGSNPTAQITAQRTVPAGKSITIYDGSGASADLSDLVGAYPDNTTKRFFGLVKISSDQPLVAMVNQESTPASGNRAGTYNVPLTTEGTNKISVPLIQSGFYGCYTSLTIATVDGGEASLSITYKSDADFSSVKNQTKAYNMSTSSGFLNRYEGPPATADQSDLKDDPFWGVSPNNRFIGSATIQVLSGSKIVAFVNSECTQSNPAYTPRDAMYTFNAINLP